MRKVLDVIRSYWAGILAIFAIFIVTCKRRKVEVDPAGAVEPKEPAPVTPPNHVETYEQKREEVNETVSNQSRDELIADINQRKG